MGQFEIALRLAATYHEGQIDKQGEPYIYHPLRVAMAVEIPLRPAAVLHDVVEDTPMELSTLRLYVDTRTVQLVDRLTYWKPKRTPRSEYIARICEDPDAVEIKVADIEDNLKRVKGLDLQERGRLSKKYEKDLDQIAAAGYHFPRLTRLLKSDLLRS